MLTFPNCKINLGLTITRKRNDGYHDLQTVFYPIAIKDVLEIIAVRNGPQPEIENPPARLAESGLPVGGNKNDNLCLKAYDLLKRDFPHLPRVDMHLHKAIPMGAGLGGGSSDGASVLKLLNDLFSLHLTRAQLIGYAEQLGSDCPFFIINTPCLATGRGEVMQEILLDLSAYSIVLVNPGIHLDTGWAFSQLRISRERPDNPSSPPLREIIFQPVSTWKNTLFNDFEEPVFESFPGIRNIKEELYRQGAIYASMTGSGSTVFGLFDKQGIPEPAFPPEYTVMVT